MAKRFSNIANISPSFLDLKFKSAYSWLDSKRIDDNIEGLWRIDDNLYDLTDFIERHPGGPDWLRLTKGTDITEAFEVHHLNEDKVKPLLEKFLIRKATTPRNIRLTFKENGFYKTLKRRVVKELPNISRTPEIVSKVYSDSLLFATFLFGILTMKYQNILLAAVTGILLTLTAISGHNFFHRKDNFRMMYFNFSMFSYREWRILHALSHHLYPNSLQDLEVVIYEDVLSFIPNPKGIFKRYISWIYGPLFWTVLYSGELLKRILHVLFHQNAFYKEDLIPFSLPLVMFISGNGCFLSALQWWSKIMLFASFFFGLVGYNNGHHHPEVVHDGDTIREDLDWGLYQLDTVIDRQDLKWSSFLVLTHFGEHALHHLFPTLDHGLLPKLYPILYQTMDEYKCELKSLPWFPLIAGQFKQLARTEPLKDCPQKRSKFGRKQI